MLALLTIAAPFWNMIFPRDGIRKVDRLSKRPTKPRRQRILKWSPNAKFALTRAIDSNELRMSHKTLSHAKPQIK